MKKLADPTLKPALPAQLKPETVTQLSERAGIEDMYALMRRTGEARSKAEDGQSKEAKQED